VTKRSEFPGRRPAYPELITAIAALDLAMKQPIVLGVYEDSLTVDDEHIATACRRVRNELANIAVDIERITHAALMGAPASTVQ